MHRPSILLTCLAAAILLAASPRGDKAIEAARLNNLGAAYMNQQLFEKALKYFEDAAKLDSGLKMARLNQGIALLNLGRAEAARPMLLEAAKNSPSDPRAWYNLGLLYKSGGDAEAAIAAFLKVIEISRDDADTWYFLGTAYVQAKQYPQAIEAFEGALKLNPTHASAEFGLARAWQQSGNLAQAREHLGRFQHIKDAKLGAPIALAYGEQGKYSLADESPLFPEKVPEQIRVQFVDVTEAGGLAIAPGTAKQGASPDAAEGPGACFLDYDDDARIDLLLPGGGPFGGVALYHNEGGGKFKDVTVKAGLDPHLRVVSCTAGDYDNDGATDIAIGYGTGVALLHNEKNGRFRDVTAAAGIRSGGDSPGITFMDYDHDGDLDLYVIRGGAANSSNLAGQPGSGEGHFSNVLFRNNGNGTFTDVTQDEGVAGNGESVAVIGTDYNNDRAVDLVVAGGIPQLFENPREGRFVERRPWPVAMPSATAGVAALDFNHDGWMDLAFTIRSEPGLSLWRNREGKGFEPVPLPGPSWARGWGVAAIDYDNDGWVDVAAVGETKDGRGEVRLFRNLGPEGFKDVTADVGLDKIKLVAPRALITGDYDNDGATDLLITQNQGPAVLLRNAGGNQNQWLRLNLKGLADNRSAIGTKVEVFSGGNRQKFEIPGSSGYLGANSPYLTVGLGAAKQADIVRMLWPTGVLQDEVEVPADREQKYVEIDRRGSSCPTLFAWDGHRYRLVADMLGAGVVGHWVGPGERNVPRPVEYVKIDREALREESDSGLPNGGRKTGHRVLRFRFMEPLEEAVYLDQVELLAVDHPAEFEVYPNEFFASNPPYPPFKVVFSRNARLPAGAWDKHGHDVLPELRARRYFGDFEVLPFAGFTKSHSLELDLGEAYDGGPLWLLMHGEIEYFSATSMYAADQAGLHPIAPFVEALTPEGKWIRVSDDMGFPAGGARTMTADLSGRVPRGARRIRITTNLQIYWDSILVSRTRQEQRARLTEAPLMRAQLSFHGFPLKIEGTPPGNVQYAYEKTSATGPYTHLWGAYTRYGDVRALLEQADDRLVVFGSGDEVALDFDSSNLPALPRDWVRDYFFAARGYEKDMDFYAYDFTEVEPLPFGKMGGYPYPGKSFPLDDAHLNYLLEYNTRFVSGKEERGYGFQYPGR